MPSNISLVSEFSAVAEKLLSEILLLCRGSFRLAVAQGSDLDDETDLVERCSTVGALGVVTGDNEIWVLPRSVTSIIRQA